MKNFICSILFLFVKKYIDSKISDDELRNKITNFIDSDDFELCISKKYLSCKKVKIKDVNNYSTESFRKIVSKLDSNVEDKMCDLVGDLVAEHKAMREYIEEFSPDSIIKIS